MTSQNSTSSVDKQISKLLPDYVRKRLPPLGATSEVVDPLAVVKFFTPDAGWTWYAIEFDGEDVFYGLVEGLEREFGSFSLKELLSIRGKLGLPVERDRFFEPKRISQIHSWRTY